MATLGDTPEASPLKEVVAALGRIAKQLEVRPEPTPREPVPGWVTNALVASAGLSPDEVAAMTPDDAMARLQQDWSNPPGS